MEGGLSQAILRVLEAWTRFLHGLDLLLLKVTVLQNPTRELSTVIREGERSPHLGQVRRQVREGEKRARQRVRSESRRPSLMFLTEQSPFQKLSIGCSRRVAS